ncbi:hypothetical protein CSW57_07095 [Williamsia muralis]|uniref:Uncharacterized protein n=1 Tax=Williamsia marianensis TaxID=85044 RepID=A0A2G3PNX7_WILMA|nr:hypothetical protein CSW57_07095 [Williamsia marianensis]
MSFFLRGHVGNHIKARKIPAPRRHFIAGIGARVDAVIGLICDSAWAMVASVTRSWFTDSPPRQAQLSATGGLMMIGLGGTLALSGNKA